MKKAILIFTLLLSMFLDAQTVSTSTYSIPSGGGTKTLTTLPSQIKVVTNGSVTLSGNYTLQYSALPSVGTTWKVYCDFHQLNLNGNTVSIFGQQPLVAYPQTDTFYILFWVDYNVSGTPVLNKYYCSDLVELKTVQNTVTFNSRVNFNDSVYLYGGKDWLKPTTPITTGQTVTALDTTGKLGYGCAPWCITGNSGLSPTTNFLGTTDTGSLRFRVNNVASGIVDYNSLNTALGYQALKSNTSGVGSSAFGYWALKANTTGIGNTALGQGALVANLSGSQNTAVGENSLQANTTGVHNTAIGDNSLQTPTTGGSNIAVGYGADAATSSTTKAIAIGSGAIASSNQLAIAGVRSISIPQMSSSVRCVLTDTSGTGDFIPQPIPQNAQTTLTPLTGDSVTVTTSANLINPAGTIANFTLKLPASPYSGQLLEFSTTQTITTVHWSTALSADAYLVDSHVPTTLSAGGVIKIMFNSATSKWYNY